VHFAKNEENVKKRLTNRETCGIIDAHIPAIFKSDTVILVRLCDISREKDSLAMPMARLF
jgi:hypothetical protein